MDTFKFVVGVRDAEMVFSFASYDTRKKPSDLSAKDYLPIVMEVEKCVPIDPNKAVDILGLVSFCQNENQSVRTDFRKHYIQALLGEDTDWILVGVKKDEINILLTFYSQHLNARDSLLLDVRSRDISSLMLEFEVPHLDGFPNTKYNWDISRDYIGSKALEITDLHKTTKDMEIHVNAAEDDDDVDITVTSFH